MSDLIVPAGSAATAKTPHYDPKKHDPFFDGVSDALAEFTSAPSCAADSGVRGGVSERPASAA